MPLVDEVPHPDGQHDQTQGHRPRTDSPMDDEVSDVASCRSVNSDEVDEFLAHSEGEGNLGDLDGKDNEVILANRQCKLSIDAIFAREFGGEEPRPSLPPVSEKLVSAVTTWMRVTPNREKIKEMFQEALLPDNVEGLLPVWINDILYQHLPFKAKENDQRLHRYQYIFCEGTSPPDVSVR